MYRDERIAYENMYAEMIELRASIYASLGWTIKLINVLRKIDSFKEPIEWYAEYFYFSFLFLF